MPQKSETKTKRAKITRTDEGPAIVDPPATTATVQEETRDLRNQQAQHALDVSQWRIDQRNSGKSMAEVNEMERRGEGPR